MTNKRVPVHQLRKSYQTTVLTRQNAEKDPFAQFRVWFDEALAAEFVEPNAMCLATVGKHGEISSRMVLLKSFDERGFVFFTNYRSRKAQELDDTHRAALNFWWDKLYRQVRIVGQVEKISSEESAAYFQTRPRGSQIGALASEQSKVIENFAVLEEKFRCLRHQYRDRQVPCPEYWGGYRVVPDSFEFWQGRPDRLHDRLYYTPTSGGKWKIARLSP